MLLRVSDVVIHFWKWFFHDFWSICLGTSFRFRKNKIGEQLFQMRRVISNATAKETPPNKCKLFQENRENNKNNISKEMCVSGQQTTTKQKRCWMSVKSCWCCSYKYRNTFATTNQTKKNQTSPMKNKQTYRRCWGRFPFWKMFDKNVVQLSLKNSARNVKVHLGPGNNILCAMQFAANKEIAFKM